MGIQFSPSVVLPQLVHALYAHIILGKSIKIVKKLEKKNKKVRALALSTIISNPYYFTNSVLLF